MPTACKKELKCKTTEMCTYSHAASICNKRLQRLQQSVVSQRLHHNAEMYDNFSKTSVCSRLSCSHLQHLSTQCVIDQRHCKALQSISTSTFNIIFFILVIITSRMYSWAIWRFYTCTDVVDSSTTKFQPISA